MASPERTRPAQQDAAGARLDALLAEFGGILRTTIRHLCRGSQGLQADEIEQEVRIRLWQSLQDERIVSSPASYLKRIAVTAVIDAVRRIKARREEPLPPAELQAERPPGRSPAVVTPLERVEAGETVTLVERALQRLQPPRERAVRLHLQGFGPLEIAQLQGWTEPKTRNLVYRGLTDLRRELRASGLDVEAQ
jgi:RNA polymerase sigma factor (sigma-70 family)